MHGLIRRSSSYDLHNIEHIRDKLILHYGDMQNEHHLCALLNELKPDEVYHLAAQSDVGVSFEIPEYTAQITGMGTLYLLEAIRKFSPESRLYNAATSELFGSCPPLQNENSPMHPRNPYGIAKLFAYHMVRLYRESYGLFVCSGIMFNHESPRRGVNFVTRKIVKTACEIARGEKKELVLGNLEAKRDWGFSGDYTKLMNLMLQQKEPDDFVIGTGEAHSVKEFVEETFKLLGLQYYNYVRIDEKYYRPSETNYLQADISKVRRKLGWEPKVKFKELIQLMVEADK